MSTQSVNLEGISTITWDNFPVNKLVIDGTTNWMKVDNFAYSVGGKVWVSGVEKTITALDDTGVGSVTYVEGGSDVVLATTDSTLSAVAPTDPNQTPFVVGQTLYINGVTAKEVQSVTNSTTILFTDQTTLDYANLGSTTISTAPTNSTLFYVGQTLYVGSDDRVVSSIVGSVIYFTDGTNIDSANLGTSTLSTTAPQGNLTPFNVETRTISSFSQSYTPATHPARPTDWSRNWSFTDGTSVDENTSISPLVTINIDDPNNTTQTTIPSIPSDPRRYPLSVSNTDLTHLESFGYRRGIIKSIVGTLIEIEGYNGAGSTASSTYYETNGVINTWYYDYSKSSAWNYSTYGVNCIWAKAPYMEAYNNNTYPNNASYSNVSINDHKRTKWVNNEWGSEVVQATAMNRGNVVTWQHGTTLTPTSETSEIQHTSGEHPFGQYIGGPMKWVGTKTGHTASIDPGKGNNYDLNIFVTAMTQNQITGRNLDGLIFTCTFDPQTRTWTYA